jgi:hypothetical protein
MTEVISIDTWIPFAKSTHHVMSLLHKLKIHQREDDYLDQLRDYVRRIHPWTDTATPSHSIHIPLNPNQ